jgi:hypothetical protein
MAVTTREEAQVHQCLPRLRAALCETQLAQLDVSAVL